MHVGSALDAEIVPGDEASVTVRGDDNVLDRIEILERRREVSIRLERAVRLRDATVQATRLDVSASGSSNVVLAGRAEGLSVSASGASDADLAELVVDGDADVRASGSSDVVVHVEGALHARASGASDVRYGGAPTAVSAEESGAASIGPSG